MSENKITPINEGQVLGSDCEPITFGNTNVSDKPRLNYKDFRSGNLVKYDGRIFEIDTIAKEFPTLNTDEFGIGVVDWNNIEPIPLSEDVLIKFTHDGRKFSSGFTSDPQERPASKRYELGSFEINQANEDEQIFDVEICGCIIELKFVHDLQNAFWLFNKEELIYTP